MKVYQELDAQVAEKVMGLNVHWITEDPGRDLQFTYPVIWNIETNMFTDYVEEYSSDIAEAWKVVEKMTADGWFFSICFQDNNWNAVFETGKHKIGYTMAGFAPLAICLAALKTVEHQLV